MIGRVPSPCIPAIRTFEQVPNPTPVDLINKFRVYAAIVYTCTRSRPEIKFIGLEGC